MDASDFQIPKDLLYTKEHEWAKEVGPVVRIGITDYAAKTLNDIVYVTVPKTDERVAQMETMGTVESIKAVSELYSPLSGTITSVNSELFTHPELINKSPYGDGWLLELKADDYSSERKRLLDAAGYLIHLESLLREQPPSHSP